MLLHLRRSEIGNKLVLLSVLKSHLVVLVDHLLLLHKLLLHYAHLFDAHLLDLLRIHRILTHWRNIAETITFSFTFQCLLFISNALGSYLGRQKESAATKN